MHRLRLIERSRSLYRSKLFCTRQVGERKSSRGLLVTRKASSLVKITEVSNCNSYRDKSFTRTLLNPGPNRDSFNPCTFLQVQSKTHVHNQNRLSQSNPFITIGENTGTLYKVAWWFHRVEHSSRILPKR